MAESPPPPPSGATPPPAGGPPPSPDTTPDGPRGDAPGAGAGRVMLTLGFVSLLALLTWFFAGREAARINPNGEVAGSVSGKTAEVRLVQNAQGHYVADGRINGQPVTFMLDTGATDVAIPADVAERLKLPHGARSVAQTANGVVEVITTQLDVVSLGAIRLRDVSASISTSDQGEFVLLGMSALRDVELVQSGRELLIRDSGGVR